MVVASALGSALLYALAAVAQQRAAVAEPLEYSLRLRLLFSLLKRPLWLVGLVGGLCIVTRPESVLMLGLIGAHRLAAGQPVTPADRLALPA